MNQNLEIHDIKPLVEIPDNSFFIFLALIFLGFILLISLIFFVIKKLKNKKYNPRKETLKLLQNIDYTNSKEASYKISKYLRSLAQTPKEKKFADEIIEKLEQYKYKKNVEDFDKQIIGKIDIFMENLDV